MRTKLAQARQLDWLPRYLDQLHRLRYVHVPRCKRRKPGVNGNIERTANCLQQTVVLLR